MLSNKTPDTHKKGTYITFKLSSSSSDLSAQVHKYNFHKNIYFPALYNLINRSFSSKVNPKSIGGLLRNQAFSRQHTRKYIFSTCAAKGNTRKHIFKFYCPELPELEDLTYPVSS